MVMTQSPWSLRARAELELRKRQPLRKAVDFAAFQSDPVGFGKDALGESYTPDVQEVMSSVCNYPVTIARSGNALGKTHCAARLAVWFYKCFPGAQVYTTAAPPEANLRRLLWGEIAKLTVSHADLFKADKVQALNISSGPQQFITGVTIPAAGTSEQREAKFNGKHAPNMLFIVDEGDAVPVEVYRGIEACMSGGNAHLLIMFNPRAASGPVFRMENEHRAKVVHLSAFRHPNVITGEDRIQGAVSREKTVRRVNEWSRPLAPGEKPDQDCFELPDFLTGCVAQSLDGSMYEPLPAGMRKTTNPAFSYMVLGMYPAQNETQLISRSWCDAAVSRWLAYVAQHGEVPPVPTGVMGLDVAEYGKDSNVAVSRYGGYVARPSKWSGIDTDETAIKAAGMCPVLHVSKAFVDGTGVGAGVAPRMARLGVPSESVKVASSPTYTTELGEFFQLRDQLWWSMREWLRTDVGAMLPPDEDLIQELVTPMYTVSGSKIRVTDKKTMRELLGRSPDSADGLGLTFAGECYGTNFDDFMSAMRNIDDGY